jgi:hypothetical protein
VKKEEMAINQWSIANCHFRMRLRRGIFKKKIARSATTDDNWQLTID